MMKTHILSIIQHHRRKSKLGFWWAFIDPRFYWCLCL